MTGYKASWKRRLGTRLEVLSDNGRGCDEGEEKRSRAAGIYVIEHRVNDIH